MDCGIVPKKISRGVRKLARTHYQKQPIPDGLVFNQHLGLPYQIPGAFGWYTFRFGQIVQSFPSPKNAISSIDIPNVE